MNHKMGLPLFPWEISQSLIMSLGKRSRERISWNIFASLRQRSLILPHISDHLHLWICLLAAFPEVLLADILAAQPILRNNMCTCRTFLQYMYENNIHAQASLFLCNEHRLGKRKQAAAPPSTPWSGGKDSAKEVTYSTYWLQLFLPTERLP